jgi:hypothetical protein
MRFLKQCAAQQSRPHSRSTPTSNYMYAAYLYILRAFDSAAASRLGRSLDPEREIAAGRWPSAAVNRCDSPSPARPDLGGTGRGPAKRANFAVKC